MSTEKRPHQYVPESWPLPLRLLAKLSHGLAILEGAGIAFCLATVIFLATWQFIERNLHGHHIWFFPVPRWIDGVIRHSVFMLGFLGGAYATYTGRHIRIDAVTRLVSTKKRIALRILTTTAALFVLTLLVQSAWGFYKLALEEAGEASQEGQIFTSARGAMIMIAGYSVIAFHFFVQVIIDLGWLVSKAEPPSHWIAEAHDEGAGLVDSTDEQQNKAGAA
jgi:TRAP-type C4-dicarboxylate transport system permease small subunit